MRRQLSFLAASILVAGVVGSAGAGEAASEPSPPNNDWCVSTDAMLAWKAAEGAASHDVYFGADFNDVNEADTATAGIYQGKFPVDQNYFDPGVLQEAKTYYWRVDEVGGTTVKGNVWNFTTTSQICLKVDLALPLCDAADCNDRWPESAKASWEIWADPVWHDMYAHPGVLNDGSCMTRLLGEPFNGPGIGGTGIMAGLTCLLEGFGGLKMAGLEMCNMDASCPGCPKVYGEPLYDPICNTWYQVTDWAELPGSIILLPLYNLPPGEYALFGYHNRFNGERNDSQPHWECICGVNCDCVPELPMTSIEAVALADAPYLGPPFVGLDYDKLSGYGAYPIGNPRGVELIQGAYNVPIQQVTSDDELVPSMIKFRTDGSAVLVIYEGTCCVEDNVRPSRMSARAVLNALVLQYLPVPDAHAPCPCDGAENVPPDVELSWQPGVKAQWHDVYLGTSLQDVNEADTSSSIYVGRQSAAHSNYAPPQPLEFGRTYYWKVDEVNETDGNSPWYGDVWSFTVYEVKASNPSPPDGVKGLPRTGVELGWSPGFTAASHDVYLGTSLTDVKSAGTSSPQYKGNQPLADTDYASGPVELGKTYYWRIDEVNEGETGSPWTGEVWSFSVINYIVVEDFESYGKVSNLVCDTWLDGIRFVPYHPWFLYLNGATVALGASYEQPPDPVHGGWQSMWYGYDNTGWVGVPYYSEAERAIGDPCDWTMSGLKTLSLWFYGDPTNDANETERMYVTVRSGDVNGTVEYGHYPDEDMNDIKVAEWHEWNLDLKDFIGVDMNNVSKMYIGFGDASSEVPGGWGLVYFDDIRLYVPQGTWPPCWDSPTQCHGDSDDTGDVKGADFLCLKNSWYGSYPNLSYDPCCDFNRDGRISGGDFLILKNNWYQTALPDCPPGGTWPPEPIVIP